MAAILNSCIHLTLECSECGHQWDIENHLDFDISEAILDAENEPCPECGEDE